jgi:hypothetical protein
MFQRHDNASGGDTGMDRLNSSGIDTDQSESVDRSWERVRAESVARELSDFEELIRSLRPGRGDVEGEHGAPTRLPLEGAAAPEQATGGFDQHLNDWT